MQNMPEDKNKFDRETNRDIAGGTDKGGENLLEENQRQEEDIHR